MHHTAPPGHRRRRAGIALSGLAALALLAGCGRTALGTVTDGPAGSGADVLVTVRMAATDCGISETAVDRGSVAFVVTNTGADPGRFRFYSGGTDLVGEIRTVEPGATRTLVVDDVIPGDWVAACSVGGDETRVSMRVGKEPL